MVVLIVLVLKTHHTIVVQPKTKMIKQDLIVRNNVKLDMYLYFIFIYTMFLGIYFILSQFVFLSPKLIENAKF